MLKECWFRALNDIVLQIAIAIPQKVELVMALNKYFLTFDIVILYV